MSLPTTPRERAGFRPCRDGTEPARTTPPFPSGFHPDGCHPSGQSSSTRFAIPCGIRTFFSRPASVDALVFCPPASISSRVRFNAHAAFTAKFNVISGPFPPFRARVRSLTLDAGPDEPPLHHVRPEARSRCSSFPPFCLGRRGQSDSFGSATVGLWRLLLFQFPDCTGRQLPSGRLRGVPGEIRLSRGFYFTWSFRGPVHHAGSSSGAIPAFAPGGALHQGTQADHPRRGGPLRVGAPLTSFRPPVKGVSPGL